MPLVTVIIVKCHACRTAREIEVALVTDETRRFLAVDHDGCLDQLKREGWDRREFAPPAATQWPSNTGVWDWLCPRCLPGHPL